MMYGCDDDDGDEGFDVDNYAHESYCFVAAAAVVLLIYQLSFADATYVLHKYRHLFPCVPTSDAA